MLSRLFAVDDLAEAVDGIPDVLQECLAAVVITKHAPTNDRWLWRNLGRRDRATDVEPTKIIAEVQDAVARLHTSVLFNMLPPRSGNPMEDDDCWRFRCVAKGLDEVFHQTKDRQKGMVAANGSRHTLRWVATTSKAGACACVFGAGAAAISLTGHAGSSLLLKGGCIAVGLGSVVILAGACTRKWMTGAWSVPGQLPLMPDAVRDAIEAMPELTRCLIDFFELLTRDADVWRRLHMQDPGSVHANELRVRLRNACAVYLWASNDVRLRFQGEAPREAPQDPPDNVPMLAEAPHNAAAWPMLPYIAHGPSAGWETLPQSIAAGHAHQDRAPEACQSVFARDADQETDENDWHTI